MKKLFWALYWDFPCPQQERQIFLPLKKFAGGTIICPSLAHKLVSNQVINYPSVFSKVIYPSNQIKKLSLNLLKRGDQRWCWTCFSMKASATFFYKTLIPTNSLLLTVFRTLSVGTSNAIVKENIPSSLINVVKNKFSSLYGIPKVLKRRVPMRPIISCSGSVVSNLSKWLAKQIFPLLAAVSGALTKTVLIS